MTKPAKKTTRTAAAERKAPVSKSKPVRKAASKAASSKATPRPAPKKTSAKATPRPARGSGSSASRSSSRATAPKLHQGLSLDRKLDITGVVLVVIGLLTLLSLLSPINSSLTGVWVSLIAQSLGLGMYLFPFGLIVGGLWLVLRNFERIPHIGVERIFGFTLLFANVLAILHFATQLYTHTEALTIAQAGRGGGYLGGLAVLGLEKALGLGGAAVALAAWLVIALALSLDLTILEMFGWAPRLYNKIAGQVDAFMETVRSRAARARNTDNGYGEFQPLPPRPGLGETQPMPNLASQMLLNAHAGGPGLPGEIESEGRVYVLPPVEMILDAGSELEHDDDLDRERAKLIEDTLSSFGAPAKVVEVNRGPTITQFGVEPDFIESRGGRMRVRVGKIASLADDLALALSARTIRIQAPVPGKGFVGIEVPNEEVGMVALRDVIESESFKRMKSPLRFALGQNVAGRAVSADLAGMPHLLIAGATGSGKSVCVNALICCLLLNNTPDDLRLIMVDPKRVELTGYNGIPHLLAPVVVELERVVAALQWVTREMDMRYRKMADIGSRNIQDYNSKVVANGGKRMPHLVVIIDELADLMMLAPDETEKTITRLAQLARATGIHLVIATQRPSVDVVTGLIKANFPARVAFAVASNVDSRVILDQPGAERLLGRGDMLFQAPDAPAPVRLQGVYVSDAEIQRLVSYWQGFSSTSATTQVATSGVVDSLPSGVTLKQIPLWDQGAPEENADPLYNEAVDLARRQGRASISMLQRKLRIGYTRAARLVEKMEEKGIVGPPEPSTGTRDILDYGPAGPPVDEQ